MHSKPLVLILAMRYLDRIACYAGAESRLANVVQLAATSSHVAADRFESLEPLTTTVPEAQTPNIKTREVRKGKEILSEGLNAYKKSERKEAIFWQCRK